MYLMRKRLLGNEISNVRGRKAVRVIGIGQEAVINQGTPIEAVSLGE